MSARRHRPVSVERDAALYALGLDPANVEWHHTPPLSVRQRLADGRYDPDENDPKHIVPLTPESHARHTFGPSKATSAGGDIHNAAKVKRVAADTAAFRQRLLAKEPGKPREKTGRIRSRGFNKSRSEKFSGETVRRGQQ